MLFRSSRCGYPPEPPSHVSEHRTPANGSMAAVWPVRRHGAKRLPLCKAMQLVCATNVMQSTDGGLCAQIRSLLVTPPSGCDMQVAIHDCMCRGGCRLPQTMPGKLELTVAVLTCCLIELDVIDLHGVLPLEFALLRGRLSPAGCPLAGHALSTRPTSQCKAGIQANRPRHLWTLHCKGLQQVSCAGGGHGVGLVDEQRRGLENPARTGAQIRAGSGLLHRGNCIAATIIRFSSFSARWPVMRSFVHSQRGVHSQWSQECSAALAHTAQGRSMVTRKHASAQPMQLLLPGADCGAKGLHALASFANTFLPRSSTSFRYSACTRCV